ncbi:hypothetical protein QTL95_22640 [Rhizobium sp. S152]|uniref:hypothetical protein n=1 Tax=Rhizobium sp. S152 TaxID=3055038 RepID=UPI0025A9C996|nr:hypothetical protein [Rhizobium sp. S152]MDM9628696.1 hypothetical protein [Rhizobium sp. S152]
MTRKPTISVLATITDPGNPAKPNEDRLGHNEACAFVIDGATGLGDRQYIDETGSDAAWIAAQFADSFRSGITRDTAISDIARAASLKARATFTANHPEVPRYAWPLSAFAMVHAAEDSLSFYGLGDSCLFLLREDGTASLHMAIPGAYTREQAHAQSHIARTGGITKGGGALGDAETLTALRKHRESQNTPGGIWTLGLVPEAADHLVSEKLAITGKAHAIVCSDGLSDLVVLYEAYDAAGLVRAALDRGLGPLVEQLRRFERETDPEGLRYPRFKQCDDTTAILVELTA